MDFTLVNKFYIGNYGESVTQPQLMESLSRVSHLYALLVGDLYAKRRKAGLVEDTAA